MRPVAVTGVGLVTSVGPDAKTSFAGLLAGRDGHRQVRLFDTRGSASDRGAEIESLAVPDVPGPVLRRMLRVDRIAMLAAEEAVSASGLPPDARARTGVYLGAGAAGLLEGTAWFAARAKGEHRPLLHHFGEIQSATGRFLAARFGLGGPRACPSTACSSSLTAIGLGARAVAEGRVDAAVVGGAESLTPLTWSGFHAVSALGPEPCRPFSIERKGMSLGEAGAILVLEPEDRAAAHGATVLARVLGFGSSADAYHMTAPHPDGAGSALAVVAALREAECEPGDIDAVFAHGTGTLLNDAAECATLRTVFGAAAKGLPVVSQKSAFGHPLGAAGAVEAVVAVLSLVNDVVPGNLRVAPTDPELAPFAFPPRPRYDAGLHTVLKQSFGFGGTNAALILGRGDAA